MMNPDLMYTLHQQRLQSLRDEAERERAQRDCASTRTPWVGARLAIWLQRFSTRRLQSTQSYERSRNSWA
jgi:hypothetical protein